MRNREIGHFMRMSSHRCGAMHFIKLNPSLSYSLSNFPRSFLSLFSTVVSPQTQATSAERISIIDYLNANFKFSNAQSIYVSKRLSQVRFPQHPLSVVNYFKHIGFSESQINSLLGNQPQILFSRFETLKPKIEYLQLQGLEGSELGEFLSENSCLLTFSLNRTIAPLMETLGKFVSNKKDFIKALHRYGYWKIAHPRRILHNAALFESWGIVGSQLSRLVIRQPWLSSAPESVIRNYVARAVNMGFNLNSRMLVHAIMTMGSLSMEKFNGKLELIQSCGFSEEEVTQMFRRAPGLLLQSEKKLKFGVHVCLDKIMLSKSLLVTNPVILMLSMEKRVIPRWRVLQLLISKNLLKKNPRFFGVLKLQEKKFLEKYISKFRDNEEALLEAYKGHCLSSLSVSHTSLPVTLDTEECVWIEENREEGN